MFYKDIKMKCRAADVNRFYPVCSVMIANSILHFCLFLPFIPLFSQFLFTSSISSTVCVDNLLSLSYYFASLLFFVFVLFFCYSFRVALFLSLKCLSLRFLSISLYLLNLSMSSLFYQRHFSFLSLTCSVFPFPLHSLIFIKKWGQVFSSILQHFFYA